MVESINAVISVFKEGDFLSESKGAVIKYLLDEGGRSSKN